MGLLTTIGDVLSPEAFYVVNPRNTNRKNSLERISVRESLAYLFKRGRLPTGQKLTLVSSGGAVKDYIAAGFLKLFHEYGLPPDEYVLTSGSSFAVLYVVGGGDYKKLEDFIIHIPEMIKYRKPPLIVSGLNWFIPKGKEGLLKLSVLYESLKKGEQLETEEGLYITNRGAVDISQLEHRLKEFCNECKGDANLPIGDVKNVLIMALDLEKGVVALGRDHPDMPLYLALSSAIAIPHLLPPRLFRPKDSNKPVVLTDAADICYLPLLPDLIDKNSTIVAVDLAYNSSPFNDSGLDLSGVDGFKKIEERINFIRIRENTRRLTQLMTNCTPEELDRYGDRRGLRTLYIAPHIEGIPPETLKIDKSKILELIEQGYKLMKERTKDFRVPLFNVPAWIH